MADPVGRRVDAAWVIRMGGWGARALALVLVLALLFTMVNVATFAAAGHPVDSFQWWIAWLLDPMASITMATAIVFEGLLAGYSRRVGWLTATKWYAGGCTWAMNIWVSVTSGSLAGVLLHSVAPGLVLLLAEAAPRVRQHLAEIVEELVERDATRSAVDGALPVAPVSVEEPVVARPTWVAPPRPPSWATGPVVPAAAPAAQEREPQRPVGLVGTVTGAEAPVPEASTPDPVLVQVIPWPTGDPAAEGPLTDDELDAQVHQVLSDAVDAGARPPGRRAIADALGDRATPYRVRMSLQRVGEPTRVLSLNGAGSSAGQQRVHGSGGQ